MKFQTPAVKGAEQARRTDQFACYFSIFSATSKSIDIPAKGLMHLSTAGKVDWFFGV
jgi:hypothetical protein